MVGDREPDRYEMMVFAADTLDTMIVAEDVVYETLSDEQREHLDPEAIDPFAHLDPALLDVVADLNR